MLKTTLLVKILYATPFRHLLTRFRWPSVLAGHWAHSQKSAWAIKYFIDHYHIDTTEIAAPLDSFKTLNDFFIRKLKPDARPIALQGPVSPADGTVLVIENLSATTPFAIKGTTLNLEKLVHCVEKAAYYQGGTAIIVRIAPQDYHRIHFPCNGIPSGATAIPGRYESVDPFVYARGIQPLEINERQVISLETHRYETVTIIPVGALFVGSIGYTYTPGNLYRQGEELGYFAFGGSTVVLLFVQNSISIRTDIRTNSQKGQETPIKMGESLTESA